MEKHFFFKEEGKESAVILAEIQHLNPSVLFSTMMIKTIYLSFISIQEGKNDVYLLEVSTQIFYQEKSEVRLPIYSISLLAHMYPRLG